MTNPTDPADADPPIDPQHVAVWGAIVITLLAFWLGVLFIVIAVSNLLSKF